MMSSKTASDQQLEERAAEFCRVMTGTAMDDYSIIRGLVYSGKELRPLEDSDVPPASNLVENAASPAGFHAYEDAGMATGGMLSAQSLRYQVTGEPEARALADRLFDGICFIYDLGRQKTEGYFPKPYNSRYSEECSRDQYIYTMTGLKNYHAISDPATQRKVEHMMGKMAQYWVSIDYTKTYFDLPAASNLDDFMGALFLGIIHMGWRMSRDGRLLREYERLRDQRKLGARMRETLREQFLAGKTYDGGTYFRSQENPLAMKTMAIDEVWEYDMEHRTLWSDALSTFWEQETLVMLDRESGLNYGIVGFDPRSKTTFITEPGTIPELTNPLQIPSLTWGGRRRHSGSVLTAYVCLVTAHRLQNPLAAEVAREILAKLDLPKFHSYVVSTPADIPPGEQWKMPLLNAGDLAFWQWAYWLGRHRNLV